MPGDYLRIKISDNGVGMDENNSVHLFDPYFTSKKTGTGLGLTVCLGIVRRHKGTIKVDSKPGKGTVFTVLLPQDKFD
jgi:signal transduction histidine kinase